MEIKVEKNLIFVINSETLTSDYNTRLTEYGKIQSHNIKFECDVLILSPLKQCLETYVESNVIAKKIIISDLLKERNNISSDDIICYEESEEDVVLRIKELLKFLSTLTETEIAIFSHKEFIEIFIKYFNKTSTKISQYVVANICVG